MAKNFSELRAKMSPEAQARSAALAEELLREMPLHELRRARDLAQKTLGELLDMTQPEVSKLEQRTDALISTVRHYVEALGGNLDIIARFPNGDVRINQFRELEDPKSAERRRELVQTR